MQDPHLFPLEIEKRAETRFARIYLARAIQSGEYSLHVKIGEHGLHEFETLEHFLGLEESDCTLNGEDVCFWKALGKKETANAGAIIDATFERYRKYLDLVLERTWDWRCALRDIGHPHPMDGN